MRIGAISLIFGLILLGNKLEDITRALIPEEHMTLIGLILVVYGIIRLNKRIDWGNLKIK
jgi:hypothetical protein